MSIAMDLRWFPVGHAHLLGFTLITVKGFPPDHFVDNPWDGPDEGLPHEVGFEVGILLVTFRMMIELWIPRS